MNSILFYPTILLILLAVVIAAWAQFRAKHVYRHYFVETNTAGLTGYEAATRLLKLNRLDDIEIQLTNNLRDHYDSQKRIVFLSPDVFNSISVTSLGIVAHEIGHALQHEEGYYPLNFRNAMVPVSRAVSASIIPLLLLGIVSSLQAITFIGMVLIILIILFQLVTLPVEYNASRRALTILEINRLVKPYELKAVDSVLRAAALTYLAAGLLSFANLVKLSSLSGFYHDK